MTNGRISVGLAAALLAGTTLTMSIAATAASDSGAQRRAAVQAKAADKALARHNGAKAVEAAEAAVALSPNNAQYRTLLGQSYLAAGRFNSAAAALSDALALDPSSGAAALHLSLAQIAIGEWSSARRTLDTHQASISPSDRGLAIALAGDPATAVAILNEAARTPGADAKTRQNLALSLALSGRWREARTIAALDMDPAEADRRVVQWMAFAQPKGAADQVASLLGVTPVADQGQPVHLALVTTAPNVAAVAQPVAPVEAFMPSQPSPAAVAEASAAVAEGNAHPVAIAETVSVPEPVRVAAPVVVAAVAVPARSAPSVTFGERREIVQAVPVRVAPKPSVGKVVTAAARPVPARIAAAAPVARRALTAGNFQVQLGAYDSAGVAKDAWGRLKRRHAALSGRTPHGTSINVDGASFYRLSVGGFARPDADKLCRSLRNAGGRCFVRAAAGDAVAQWVSNKGPQLAMR